MKKQIILLLAANPTGTDPRALDHDWGCGCPVGDEHPRWFEARCGRTARPPLG
jgi:hypothetical protein